jgi:TRAP-type C4-dicarboxylate transport system permease small subunit
MAALLSLARWLGAVNAAVLAAGRGIGVVCIALMLLIMLVQVFCRYVLGSALAWPDEAARFMMLWMTGLMAPTAFRRGGFVGIDMMLRMLPGRLVAFLTLVFLCLSALVLWVGANIGWAEVTGFSGRFDTVSLKVPASFDLSEWRKVPRAWMTASLAVGVTLLLAVNAELILRAMIGLFGGAGRLPDIPDATIMGAE